MEVITAIIAAISSGSPLVIITGFILLVFLIALPTLYKFWSTESTQLTLYSQLSERVQQQADELTKQRVEIDRVFNQRNELYEEVIKLKTKVAHLESVEISNEKLRDTLEVLKRKLDEKDKLITEKDAKNTVLIDEVMLLRDRVHVLELRLKDRGEYE
jgi:cell shape-determining protein MreC